MTPIRSKKHIFKFYFFIIFGSLFFLGMGIGSLWQFYEKINNSFIKPKEYLLLLVGVFVSFFAFYTVYRYLKNAPPIKLDEQNIWIGEEKFSWENLKNVELTGKRNFPYLISMPMEAFLIEFNDGTTKIIFDDMYSNSWEIKSFIENVIVEKNTFHWHNVTPATKTEIQFENFEVYKGNQFASLRGISLWGLIGFFLYLMVFGKKPASIGFFIFFMVFSTFWFSFNSYLMHYFQCSNQFFVVKNHNFLWKVKIFKLVDIKEIVFETQSKQPNILRVITKDFKNKIYPAGTLSDKTWLKLKSKLEKNNIEVRNECIF